MVADTGSRVKLAESRSGEHAGCFDFILPLSAAERWRRCVTPWSLPDEWTSLYWPVACEDAPIRDWGASSLAQRAKSCSVWCS